MPSGPLLGKSVPQTDSGSSSIENDLFRQADALRQVVEKPHDPGPGNRDIDDLARTYAAVIVDEVQDPEPPAVGQLVAHEIHGPALHRPFRRLGRDAIPARQLSSFLRADLQALGRVEAVGPLGVQDEPFATQHRMQAQIAIAPVLRG